MNVQMRLGEAPSRIEIAFAELDAKARSLNISKANQERFLTSDELTSARVAVDRKRKCFVLEL